MLGACLNAFSIFDFPDFDGFVITCGANLLFIGGIANTIYRTCMFINMFGEVVVKVSGMFSEMGRCEYSTN